jgi:hypothetical protein
MNGSYSRMARIAAIIGLALMTLIGSTSGSVTAADSASAGGAMIAEGHGSSLSAKELAFHDAMRKLWEDHITWTRMFIVSAAAGLPDSGPAAERLLRNQKDIGDAIKPFYGKAAGDQLTTLLRSHILIAADLLTAAKSGDAQGVARAQAQWYANADEIAAFLHAANPDNWSLNEMKKMLHKHLALTLDEAVARLNGDWNADIRAYEKIHEEILKMADMLSAGIIKQFPKKFR